jgi:hypothetical protein
MDGFDVLYVSHCLDRSDLSSIGFIRFFTSSSRLTPLQITSLPTLLSFSRQEAQMGSRVSDAKNLSDRAFLRQWIAVEAARDGAGGAGGMGWLGKIMETFRGRP